MKKDDLRVFHGLHNYGTQAGMLAEGLRKNGIQATSYVWKDEFDRLIDVNLSNKFSRCRIVRYYQRIVFFLHCFRRYNVFHFYFGLSLLPHNLDLPFYHIFGKKVVMEYLGTDVDFWLGLNGVDWRGRPVNRVELVKKIARQSKQVDKQLVCSPHYYQFVDNSIILPLAIDLNLYDYTPRDFDIKNLTFMHCPTNRKAKKTAEIEAAVKRLKDEGYVFTYKCIEHVSHQQLKEEYKSSDVVIDQLNPWYGTVSVEAMALGRPVVANYYRHYFSFDNRFIGLPIIQADVFSIYEVLKSILDGKYDLKIIGKKSREFVENVHSLDAVINQLEKIYESL